MTAGSVKDISGLVAINSLMAMVGGIAAGIFGRQALGGLGGVSFGAQLMGSIGGAAFGAITGLVIYGELKRLVGIRLTDEEEFMGAYLAIHKISSTPEHDITT